MNNQTVADTLTEVADLLEMKEETPFRSRAYRRAAESIAALSGHVVDIATAGQLAEIPGIGKGIAETITDILNTGSSPILDELRQEFPAGVLILRRIPGVGPKLAVRVFRELGVSSVADLEAVARDGRLAGLSRVGDKTAANLLRNIESLRQRDDRVPITVALRLAERVAATLRTACPTLVDLTVAGSLRRFRETIGDLDMIGTATDPRPIMDTLVGLPQVREVLGHGNTKTSVLLEAGQGRTIQLDLRLVEPADFGSLLQHFTGSKGHNIILREYALAHGKSVSEYGIVETASGTVTHCATEHEVYAALGLQYLPPEIREGGHEVALAARHTLPRLVDRSDLRGDLHAHTDWSDGSSTLDEMVAAARRLGYSYLAITDHSGGLGVANGLTIERMAAQIARIRAFNNAQASAGHPFRLLIGTEVDIRADGSLDYPDDLLAQLDIVVASIHSAMNQPPEKTTERLIRAIQNPHVDIIGHPTARLLGQRPPVAYDRAAVFAAAAAAGVALEINAPLERLDLNDVDAAYAREMNIMLSINSDAHHVDGLDAVDYGVRLAHRAWIEPHHVLNTRDLSGVLEWLRGRPGAA